MDHFHDPDRQKTFCLRPAKRIVSEWARNAPFLLLNYRDTRRFMGQNANGIATNNTYPDYKILQREFYGILTTLPREYLSDSSLLRHLTSIEGFGKEEEKVFDLLYREVMNAILKGQKIQ